MIAKKKKAVTHTTSVCSECPGRCCTGRRFVFGTLYLDPGEADQPRFKKYAKHISVDGTKEKRAVIDISKGCPYLEKSNRCGIYNRRPNACRGYVCYTHPGTMDEIEHYPTHKRLLNRWQVLPGQKYGLDPKEYPEFSDYGDKPKQQSK